MQAYGLIAALLLGIATASGARADDVTDQIDAALRAYQNHETQTAIAALDAASSLMRQSRADVLKKLLLPPPPPGWTADAAASSAISVAMLAAASPRAARITTAISASRCNSPRIRRCSRAWPP